MNEIKICLGIFLGIHFLVVGYGIILTTKTFKLGHQTPLLHFIFFPLVNISIVYKNTRRYLDLKRESIQKEREVLDKNGQKNLVEYALSEINAEPLYELLVQLVQKSYMNRPFERTLAYPFSTLREEQIEKIQNDQMVSSYMWLSPEKHQENIELKGRKVFEPDLARRVKETIDQLEEKPTDDTYRVIFQQSEETFKNLLAIIQKNIELTGDVDLEILEKAEFVLTSFVQRIEARYSVLKAEEEEEKNKQIQRLRQEADVEVAFQENLDKKEIIMDE